MLFLLYTQCDSIASDTPARFAQSSSGLMLQEFSLALEQFGPVQLVQDPASEVDTIYRECMQRGESCLFFSFTQPHEVPLSLECPTICVFPWGFDTIPDETWNENPANDWRQVFDKHGRTICLSQQAARAVQNAMGADFPVLVLPVPVDDCANSVVEGTARDAVIGSTTIAASGNLIDSKLYAVSAEAIALGQPQHCFQIPAWDGQGFGLDFSLDGGDAGYLVGFYEPESWGSWSKVDVPWILLPSTLVGEFTLSLSVTAFGANDQRKIRVKIGGQTRTLQLSAQTETHQLRFNLDQPASTIRFLGVELALAPGANDPRKMGLGIVALSVERNVAVEGEQAVTSVPGTPNRTQMNFEFGGEPEEGCLLTGFYQPEPWGVWSRTAEPSIVLPVDVTGRLTLTLRAQGYGENVGRELEVSLGDETHSLVLSSDLDIYTFHFDATRPAEAVRFRGIDVTPRYGASDPRTMGIGIAALNISGIEKGEVGTKLPPLSTSMPGQLTTQLSGVVYTSVFDPSDDRKNWIDMLTAFVFAFRSKGDATLLLTMNNPSLLSFLGTFHQYLQRLAPFECRVILVHGELAGGGYSALIDCSSYYVNTSRSEDYCGPLAAFVAGGRPAIAPSHSAMKDFLREDSSFLVASTPEPAAWPHDPRRVIRTFGNRLEWWSLVECFRQSYTVAKQDAARYKSMSREGAGSVRRLASREQLRRQLPEFLQLECKV